VQAYLKVVVASGTLESFGLHAALLEICARSRRDMGHFARVAFPALTGGLEWKTSRYSYAWPRRTSILWGGKIGARSIDGCIQGK